MGGDIVTKEKKISIKLDDEDLERITIQYRTTKDGGVTDKKDGRPLLELFNDKENVKNIELTPRTEFYSSDKGISLSDILTYRDYIHYSRRQKKWWIIKNADRSKIYIDFYLNEEELKDEEELSLKEEENPLSEE